MWISLKVTGFVGVPLNEKKKERKKTFVSASYGHFVPSVVIKGTGKK